MLNKYDAKLITLLDQFVVQNNIRFPENFRRNDR